LRFGSLRTPFPFVHPGLAEGQEAAALLRKPTGEETMPEARTDVYSHITNKFIADLEQGVRPWNRP
jgi:hypothetical protein